MSSLGAFALVIALVVGTLVAVQFARMQQDSDDYQQTIVGFESLVAGAYAFRTDNPTQWPSSLAALCTAVPSLDQNPCGGSNGEGRPFTLTLTSGNLAFATEVEDETHALSVQRSFGSSATTSTLATGLFEINLSVPNPGGITLVRQTLLTDGSNDMQDALHFQSTSPTIGGTCSGLGLAPDTTGALLVCQGGTWQAYTP